MLQQIFNGDYLKRLDNIIQWQEVDVLKHESVASHSYKAAVFARLALEDLFENIETVEVMKFKLEVFTATLFHDWDESLLRRDISHDTKYNEYNGNLLREVLNDLSKHLAEEEFSEIDFACENQTSSAVMLKNCITPINGAVHAFVKFCDWLAVIFYIRREISLGNKDFFGREVYALERIAGVRNNLIDVLKEKFPELNLHFDKI